MVTVHVALGRQPWTTCRRHCNSGQCSSRLRTAGTSTPETRGQACWSCTLPVATQLCKGANLNLNSQTCSLYATPACCKICQPRALHLLAQLCEQAAQVSGTASAWMWCFRPAWNHAPGHAYWNQDPEYSVKKNARLPRAPWDLVQFFMEEAEPMFAGPPLDYRRWTKIGLPPRPPETCRDAQGPGPLRFAPSLRKQAALDGKLLSRLFFSQDKHTEGLHGSQYRCLFFWYYYTYVGQTGIFSYW